MFKLREPYKGVVVDHLWNRFAAIGCVVVVVVARLIMDVLVLVHDVVVCVVWGDDVDVFRCVWRCDR